jgi:biopolymer transport protein ExbB/TolQ
MTDPSELLSAWDRNESSAAILPMETAMRTDATILATAVLLGLLATVMPMPVLRARASRCYPITT